MLNFVLVLVSFLFWKCLVCSVYFHVLRSLVKNIYKTKEEKKEVMNFSVLKREKNIKSRRESIREA